MSAAACRKRLLPDPSSDQLPEADKRRTHLLGLSSYQYCPVLAKQLPVTVDKIMSFVLLPCLGCTSGALLGRSAQMGVG